MKALLLPRWSRKIKPACLAGLPGRADARPSLFGSPAVLAYALDLWLCAPTFRWVCPFGDLLGC